MEMRNVNIGAAVAFAIFAIDLIFFRHAGEAVRGAIAMVGFLSAFVVYHVLDERERARSRAAEQHRDADAKQNSPRRSRA
jgi:hypothetical protein